MTQQGITLRVQAMIAFEVGSDTESIVNAAQRFLSDQSQMEVLTRRIFAGQLRQQQLAAEVVKPAEAEAEKRHVPAHADAEATKVQAEAAASNDRVALDRMLIGQLPQILREASAGFAQANVNVLDGVDGLAEMAAGLVTQGVQIYGSVKATREATTGGTRGEIENETGDSNGTQTACATITGATTTATDGGRPGFDTAPDGPSHRRAPVLVYTTRCDRGGNHGALPHVSSDCLSYYPPKNR